MQRLLTKQEINRYLPLCQEYTRQEFGDETLPVDFLSAHIKGGAGFYQPYGEFSVVPPKILGLVNVFMISHLELAALKRGERREEELAVWHPDDGQAVLWLCSVTSEVPGIAAKCSAKVLTDIEQHPYKNRIDRVATICTGPQGYLMATMFGLKDRGIGYGNGWTFMERELGVGEIGGLGFVLENIWTMTKARDVVQSGRRLWGKDWRSYSLQLADLDKGRT
jgi:hypothetical protein